MPRLSIAMPTELGGDGREPRSRAREKRRRRSRRGYAATEPTPEDPPFVRWLSCWATAEG